MLLLVMKKEKNIQIFDKDVRVTGGYLYTNPNKVSSVIATKRQTDEMIKVVKKHLQGKLKILDIGCGDGIYTMELYKKLKPAIIVGIDPAADAIKAAKKRITERSHKEIQFKVDDIYYLADHYKENTFDLVVIRGVLHHLYDPKKAIKQINKISNNILVLEPNGYNPILKVIEKVSPYHRLHEEKSYWPPQLNTWFKKYGFGIVDQRFFSIVPYFTSDSIARFLKKIEPFFERIPFISKYYCGTNLILYSK